MAPSGRGGRAAVGGPGVGRAGRGAAAAAAARAPAVARPAPRRAGARLVRATRRQVLLAPARLTPHHAAWCRMVPALISTDRACAISHITCKVVVTKYNISSEETWLRKHQ